MDAILQGKTDAAAPDLIKDTTTQSFMADVIDASHEVPVLVDFWAPWCGPCKQLTPILEKAVKAAKGAVKLVKMNIDEHPGVAGQMGVRSIPAVFAFKNGRPVDGFMGALPEGQVKSFIDRVVGPGGAPKEGEDELATAAKALEAGDVNTAAEIYAALLQRDGHNLDAIAGLAKCYIRASDLDRAEQTLKLAPADGPTNSAIASARSALELARKAQSAGDVDSLRAKVAANPKDFQARYDLAIALNAKGDHAGAVEELLAIVVANRNWNEEAARKQLLQFFEVWGPSDENTLSGRRRLSSLLFA